MKDFFILFFGLAGLLSGVSAIVIGLTAFFAEDWFGLCFSLWLFVVSYGSIRIANNARDSDD